MSGAKFVVRLNEDRGHADHIWLKTFHTFSFSTYRDSQHEQFGPLRVINEDRVQPDDGFGTHGHQEFEIFSYIVSGKLEHKDSMGNTEILKRGDVQMTSAGTGVRHSEVTHGSEPVHFIQIWAVPSTSQLKPKYFSRNFSDKAKRDTLLRVVAPTKAKGVSSGRKGRGPAPIHSPLTLYCSLLSPAKTLSHTFEGIKGYIQIIQTSGYNPRKAAGNSIRITSDGGQQAILREGDGSYIFVGGSKTMTIENVGDDITEFLLFDLE